MSHLMMNLLCEFDRRRFFQRMGDGLFGAGLAWLLARDGFYGPSTAWGGENATAGAAHDSRRVPDLRPRSPHFAPRAKSVIQLFMQGGPSQMDLFDPKPVLDQHHGEPYFDKLAADLTGPEQAGALLRSPFKFAQHGESGAWVSEVLPHTAGIADELAVIRSMHTTHPNHEPAILKWQSGQMLPGYPTLGAWTVYGLGSENQSLPAFVVLPDAGLPVNGVQNWQSGFLPPVYQGTRIRSQGAPLLNLSPETAAPADVTRTKRELLARLDALHKRERPGQPRLDARIASYELAARMQLEAADALDISRETAETLALYGVGEKETDDYGRRCLFARRLVERGVRFIQICTKIQTWDNHSAIESGLRTICGQTDKPIAGLLRDLKRRGLLDETLIVWGGEFGRMPIAQMNPGADPKTIGRDHNPRTFTVWLAGGGVKAGTVFGASDELGYQAVENPVSVADLHATILHQLGLSHEQLFFERNGLREKLTGVLPARVVQEVLTS